jgi:hypothetical protein
MKLPHNQHCCITLIDSLARFEKEAEYKHILDLPLHDHSSPNYVYLKPKWRNL